MPGSTQSNISTTSWWGSICFGFFILQSTFLLHACQSNTESASHAPVVSIAGDTIRVVHSQLVFWDYISLEASTTEGLYRPINGIVEKHFSNDSTLSIAVTDLVKRKNLKFISLWQNEIPPMIFLQITYKDGFDTLLWYYREGLSHNDLSRIDSSETLADGVYSYLLVPDSVQARLNE